MRTNKLYIIKKSTENNIEYKIFLPRYLKATQLDIEITALWIVD